MTIGLYVQKLANGMNHSVQVEDSTGMQWDLDPDQYNMRGHQPPIDDLPTLEAYTRDRYLVAVSAAFGDATTRSPVGGWQIFVESTPKREIVLMPAFVTRNITRGGMQPSDLTKHLQSLPESDWSTHESGARTIVLN